MEATSTQYPTDLTDEQWRAVRPCLPPAPPLGADRRTSMRAVINAVLYRLRARCAWRMLPHDFPHWRTVYGYFRQWQQDGTWKKIQQLQTQWRSESRQSTNGRQGEPLEEHRMPL